MQNWFNMTKSEEINELLAKAEELERAYRKNGRRGALTQKKALLRKVRLLREQGKNPR